MYLGTKYKPQHIVDLSDSEWVEILNSNRVFILAFDSGHMALDWSQFGSELDCKIVPANAMPKPETLDGSVYFTSDDDTYNAYAEAIDSLDADTDYCTMWVFECGFLQMFGKRELVEHRGWRWNRDRWSIHLGYHDEGVFEQLVADVKRGNDDD